MAVQERLREREFMMNFMLANIQMHREQQQEEQML